MLCFFLTGNGGVRGVADVNKFIFNSVKVSIVKKSSSNPNGDKPIKETEKLDAQFTTAENKGKSSTEMEPVTSNGLMSLCQQYGSDEDDWW